MRLNLYFDRIGYLGEAHPALPVLRALQRAHLCAVPFENVDVQLGRPVTTSAAAAFDKIVNGGRGGWCYEHNGLFGWALAAIGFDVTRVAASVMRHKRGDIADANHLCLLVRIPGAETAYLVDVGFGGSLIEPIELAESEHQQAPFRLGLRRLDGHKWRFWEDVGNGEFSFDFAPEPADEKKLNDKCEFLQTSPSSSFVLNLVAQLRAPREHRTLRGRVFSVASPAGIRSRVLNSPDELVATLLEHFCLDVPEVADLWHRIVARHDELFCDRPLVDTYEVRDRSHNEPFR